MADPALLNSLAQMNPAQGLNEGIQSLSNQYQNQVKMGMMVQEQKQKQKQDALDTGIKLMNVGTQMIQTKIPAFRVQGAGMYKQAFGVFSSVGGWNPDGMKDVSATDLANSDSMDGYYKQIAILNKNLASGAITQDEYLPLYQQTTMEWNKNHDNDSSTQTSLLEQGKNTLTGYINKQIGQAMNEYKNAPTPELKEEALGKFRLLDPKTAMEFEAAQNALNKPKELNLQDTLETYLASKSGKYGVDYSTPEGRNTMVKLFGDEKLGLAKDYNDQLLQQKKAGATNVGNVTVGGLGKATETKLEGDIIDADNKIASFNEIRDLFNPKFLTYYGSGEAIFQKLSEKAGIPVNTDFLKQKTTWKQQAQSAFLEWRKWITGVSGGENEMKQIAKSFPDPEKNSPTEFLANLQQAQTWTTKIKNRLIIFRSLGIDRPTKEQLKTMPLDSIPTIIPSGKQQQATDVKQMSNEELMRIIKGE